MKKLSEKQRLRHIRLMRNRAGRRSRRQSSSAGFGRAIQARDKFRTARSALPALELDIIRRPGRASIAPPKVFSLSENYDDTLAFLYDFRTCFYRRGPTLCPDGNKRRVYAEFGDIEQIGAGAGLVLAAEIHRYAQSSRSRFTIHDETWAENVRNYFIETGLFELLNVDPHSILTRVGMSDSRVTLKYQSGKKSSGKDALQLRERLQELAGQPVGGKIKVYNAIAEALANVDHAYPQAHRTWPYPNSGGWWTSGFWEPSSKTVGLQLYDQGAGIPATLPNQTHWPRILKFLDPERTDAGLIAAAMEYGRTSTGKQGRGKGLAEMADWIESSKSGFLRILSGSGEVTYRPGRSISKRNRNGTFLGTLVQWELSLA